MKFALALVLGLGFALPASAEVVNQNTDYQEVQIATSSAFERAARAAAAKQGWEGYPESYQDAFVAGARWGNARKKSLTCQAAQ